MKNMILTLTGLFGFELGYGQFAPLAAGELNAEVYHVTYLPVHKIQDTVYDQSIYTDHEIGVDIDGDSINDLKIYSRNFANLSSGNPGFWYPVWQSGMELDSLTDAVVVSSTTWIVDTLSFGHPLGAALDWSTYTSLALAQNTNNYSFRDTWKDQNEYFVGLRLRKASGDTLYGWLKISVEGHHIVHLEEHACQSYDPRENIITLYTSVHEQQAQQSASLYPNPFSAQSVLRTTKPLRNATVTIVDAHGRVVSQTNNVHGETFAIDRKGLASGHYVVRLREVDGVTTTLKFVVVDE
jgi:hypothetical protein